MQSLPKLLEYHLADRAYCFWLSAEATNAQVCVLGNPDRKGGIFFASQLWKLNLADIQSEHHLCTACGRARRKIAEATNYLVPREQRQGLLYLGSVVHCKACEKHDAEA